MYKKILILCIIIVVIYILIIYIKAAILYHPLPALPEKYNKFYQKIFQLTGSKKYISNIMIKTVDNILLDTIYVINPNATKCIIFFHGNAGNISMRYDIIKFLYNFASVIIFDYRSFGKSTGDKEKLSSESLHRDAETVWKFVTENLGINANNISLFGESLGCYVAIYLASKLSKHMDNKYYPHSIILNAPFFSLSSMMTNTFNKLNLGYIGEMLSLFIGREYQSNELIKFINHKTKVIIAHSPRDEVVPYNEGWKLYKFITSFRSGIQFINISGTHNNLGLTDDYIYALADLFDNDY